MIFVTIFTILFCFLSPQAFSSQKKCKQAVSSSSETQSAELKINPVLLRPIEDLQLFVLAQDILKSSGLRPISWTGV